LSDTSPSDARPAEAGDTSALRAPDNSDNPAREERIGLLYVAIAVGFFSTTPVLIRWAADNISAIEITAGRMLIAGLVVLGIARLRREPLPTVEMWPRYAVYGLVAALHFGFYIASLEYTTIAHSLALVYTAPIFVALFSWLFLQEGVTPRQWIGIGIAIVGIAILAGFEPAFDRRMLVGDLLALGSAICFGLYSVAGRSQRHVTPLFAYAGTVYTLAALWLLPFAVHFFTPGGYTLPTLASVAALGLFPLALGHTLYNAALRRTRATAVNLIATQEVTGGVLLGVLLLGEIPGPTAILGAVVTLVGIVIVLRA
jgi:drug/metabolite transporter (DMT)-like permease